MRRFGWFVVCICLVSMVGCGPGQVSVYSVKGKLTQGGQPVGDVNLTLAPAEAGDRTFASADVGPDGTFELKCSDGRMGAAAGSYKVVLAEKANADPMAAMQAMRDQMQGQGGPPMDPTKRVDSSLKFPVEYKDKAKSPKTVEVKAEDQTLDIEI